MTKKLFSIVIIFCFGFLLLSACGDKEKTSELEQKVDQLSTENTQLKEKLQKVAPEGGRTYKLGCSLAITGPTSDVGAPYSKGVEDYVKYVNDSKMLGEDKLVCFIKDDGYKTEVTKRNFEDFLNEGIVLYLNYSTGSTLALKKDFDEVKIPVIPASFDARNLIDSTYIFLPIVSYSSQTIGLLEYLVANHKGDMPKIAMFINPSAFGRAPVGDVKKALAAGLKVDLIEVVEHGQDLDYTAMIKRFMNKKVQYVICHTVQPPVATLLKGAQGLGVAAKTFGEAGKLTFMGVHYSGGPDLIALAGSAAENFYWTTSYKLTTEKGEGTTAQLALAKKYGRDEQTANSQNYTNGIQVTQIAVEAIRRAKAKGKEITRQTLYEELLDMNGYNSYFSLTTVGPISYSETDRQGVDAQQLYIAQGGIFREVGAPFASELVKKLK